MHPMPMNPPIIPGEILLKETLDPMGISQNAMARAIGVAPRAINEPRRRSGSGGIGSK